MSISVVKLDRTKLVNLLEQKLNKFKQKKTNSNVFILHGPKHSGKQYLMENLLFFKSIYLFSIIRKYSLKELKQMLIINSTLVLNLNLELLNKIDLLKLKALFRMAKKYTTKIVLLMEDKIYIQIYKLNKYFVTFKCNYLDLNEIVEYLNVYLENSICLNGFNFTNVHLANTFYSLFKKPKYLRKFLLENQFAPTASKTQIQTEIQSEIQTEIELKEQIGLYSLASLICTLRPILFLLYMNNSRITQESSLQEFIKLNLNEKFSCLNLNQFLVDLNNANKKELLKEQSWFLIQVNKYDSALDAFYLNICKRLNLKIIFILNDLNLFLKYSSLFEFKFKFKSYKQNDILVEFNKNYSNLIKPLEYYDDINSSLKLTTFMNKHVLNARKPLLIQDLNLEFARQVFELKNLNLIPFKVDMKMDEKFESIFSFLEFNLKIKFKRLEYLLFNYLIRKKKLLFLINSNFKILDFLKYSKILILIETNSQFKTLTQQFDNFDYYYFKINQLDLHSLTKELTNKLEMHSNASNVYMSLYFELKRLEFVSFNQYFQFEFNSKHELDDSIRKLNSILNLHDNRFNFKKFLIKSILVQCI